MWVKQCQKPSPKSAQIVGVNHSQSWVVYDMVFTTLLKLALKSWKLPIEIVDLPVKNVIFHGFFCMFYNHINITMEKSPSHNQFSLLKMVIFQMIQPGDVRVKPPTLTYWRWCMTRPGNGTSLMERNVHQFCHGLNAVFVFQMGWLWKNMG